MKMRTLKIAALLLTVLSGSAAAQENGWTTFIETKGGVFDLKGNDMATTEVSISAGRKINQKLALSLVADLSFGLDDEAKAYNSNVALGLNLAYYINSNVELYAALGSTLTADDDNGWHYKYLEAGAKWYPSQKVKNYYVMANYKYYDMYKSYCHDQSLIGVGFGIRF